MIGATVAWRSGALSAADGGYVKEHPSRSLPVWLDDASNQDIAAEWYQIGQRLCR